MNAPTTRVELLDACQVVADELDGAHVAAPDRGGLFQCGQVMQFAHGRTVTGRVLPGVAATLDVGATRLVRVRPTPRSGSGVPSR